MKIISKENNVRLDSFLFQENLTPSRSNAAKLIKNGLVKVNGEVCVRSAHLVLEGDEIILIPAEVKQSYLKAKAYPLEILYEDDDVLVLNKDAGLVVHPGAGEHENTLTQALLAHCGKLSVIGGIERPGLVHRLDKGTTGVMVIAKNDEAHIDLSAQFKNREVKKVYWALCFGSLKNKEGHIENLLTRHPSQRQKYIVHATKGKIAITDYTVKAQSNGLSLVEVQLHTGRTHQIRVHMSWLGYPLVGDTLYGSHRTRVHGIKDKTLNTLLKKVEFPLLHSSSLEFTHPKTKKKMKFKAKLQEPLKNILSDFFAVKEK